MNTFSIKRIDHVVITTKDLESCLSFYETLGFTVYNYTSKGEIHGSKCKINVHIEGEELVPHATHVVRGSQDLCFQIKGNLKEYQLYLAQKGIKIHTPIVERHGKWGEMKSFYVYDVDGNLLEFCQYD